MSTTEALRVQLDALQTEYYALQTENRRLREAQPEQANLADLEAQTREENVKLVQEVSQLSRRDRSETDADRETCEAELGELRRTIATLEDEVSEVREGLEKQDGELREKGEELVRAVARAERAEECVRRLEESFDRVRKDAELERYRAIAEETHKWENREARLIQRIEQLEREGVVATSDGGEDATTAVTAGNGQVLTSLHKHRYEIADKTQDSGENALVLSTGSTGSPRVKHVGSTQKGSVSFNVGAAEFIPSSCESQPTDTQEETVTLPTGPGCGEAVVPVPTLAVAPLNTLSMALLAQQLPSLPNFSGDQADGGGDTIDDWLETRTGGWLSVDGMTRQSW